MNREKIGRIGGDDWMDVRANEAFAVYNANYGIDSPLKWASYPMPWTAMGPSSSKRFTTHAEALAWAFEKAEAGA